MSQGEVTTQIDAPRGELVECLAPCCGVRFPKHESFKITLTYRREDQPGRSVYWTTGDFWEHTLSGMFEASWSRGPTVTTEIPAARLIIETFIGYACCREHAEIAAAVKARLLIR